MANWELALPGPHLVYLAFALGYMSQLMEQTTMEHLQAIKRILRYMAGTLDYGLQYRRALDTAHFVSYYDSDLAGDVDTTRAQPGRCSSSVIVWSPSSPLSRRWWPSQLVKWSTSPPPLQQLRRYGCQGCWQLGTKVDVVELKVLTSLL